MEISSLMFFLWLLLPIFAWLAHALGWVKVRPVLVYLLACVVGYLVIVFGAWVADVELEANANSYDLDGDGSFDDSELTPAAEQALKDLASDTGRTFAPIFAIPLTVIWYSLVCGLLFGVGAIVKTLRRTTQEELIQSEIAQECRVDRDDDRNPYRSPLQ